MNLPLLRTQHPRRIRAGLLFLGALLAVPLAARAQVPPPAIDLAAPAPADADSTARAVARRMVDAFGGSTELEAWVGQGERRGRQVVLAPAHVEARFVERRADPYRRVDLIVAGAELTFASGPGGGWQRFLGLVSDLPPGEQELLRVEEAHDERLLLAALRSELPARSDPGAARPGEAVLVVWGTRGSATRFRADAATGRLGAIEFVDLDPRGGEARVPQSRGFEGWRAIGPDRAPLLAPLAGMAPLIAHDRVDGELLAESAVDTLDLGRRFEDADFARPGADPLDTGSPGRVVVPLIQRGDHHFVDVRVAGGPPRRFLVDTGAGMTALSLELAAEASVDPGDSLEIVGLGGGTVARSALLPPLSVGGFVVRDVHGLVLDLAELRRGFGGALDGILGFSALARYAVTFDFIAGTLELAENGPAHAAGGGGARVPFSMVGGQVIIPVRIDEGEEVSFLVDSGAWRTFLPPEWGERLDIPAERRLPGVPSSGADGRPIEAEALRVNRLSIGTLVVPRPIVLVPAVSGTAGGAAWSLVTRARGVLGADILRGFRVTIDFPRQELILVTAPDASAPDAAPSGREDSFTGPGVVLGVARESEAAPVRRVLADSPAQRAGLRVGDRITTIDDAPTGGVRAEILRQRLAGPAGSRVRLGVRDARGRERTLTLERALLL